MRSDQSQVELVFPVIAGATVPEDHYYLVHSMLKAVCRTDIGERGWTFAPLEGDEVGDLIRLRRGSAPAFTLRLPREDVGWAQKLTGERLRVGDHLIQLGEPIQRELEPAPCLVSPLVLITSDDQPRGTSGIDFGVRLGRRLGALLSRYDFGVEAGPRRHVHIKGSRCFGHPVIVKGLTDEESILLQEVGSGGRRAMGLGSFWVWRGHGPS